MRDVIHAFNERGFDALDRKWNGGRPKTIGDKTRNRICLIARTSPADWGITAYATWSLATLREHLLVMALSEIPQSGVLSARRLRCSTAFE